MPTTYAIPNGRTVMDATTYSGTSATHAITNQFGFKPDLVWTKSRTNPSSGYLNILSDSVRGQTSGYYNNLYSDATYAENVAGGALPAQVGGITSLNSNGFTIANGSNPQYWQNESGYTYVGWQWQAGQGTTSSNTDGSITSTVSVNQAAGFSIVSYTGNLTSAGNTNIGHGLGAAPSLIISKRTTGGTSEWVVQIPFVGQNKFLILNTNGAMQDMVSAGAGTLALPTTTTFGSTYYTGLNVNTQPCIAYCWAPVAGFSAFGTYTGNGSYDGPFVYTGFRPKFVMLKMTSSTNPWQMYDSSRDPYNYSYHILAANSSSAEDSSSGAGVAIDLLSNGFKIRTDWADINTNGGSYIYMAWAENPFKFANAR